MSAKHFSKGKPPIHKVPIAMLEGIAEVLEYGAKKYSDYDWMKGMNWMELAGSAARHLWKWIWVEDDDPESKLNHLKHCACNIAFLIDYTHRNIGEDDRPRAIID